MGQTVSGAHSPLALRHDEFALHREDYATLVVEPTTRRAVSRPGRAREELRAFFTLLGPDGCALRALPSRKRARDPSPRLPALRPNAAIVADLFHVIPRLSMRPWIGCGRTRRFVFSHTYVSSAATIVSKASAQQFAVPAGCYSRIRATSPPPIACASTSCWWRIARSSSYMCSRKI